MEIRQEMTTALQGFGIDVEALHHEVAVGQHEIDFRYGDALKIADQASTLKYTLKYIATKHNLHATFTPKPIAGINGSGMHVHSSLWKGETNVFYDASGYAGLSQNAKYYIGGILKHAPALLIASTTTIANFKLQVIEQRSALHAGVHKFQRRQIQVAIPINVLPSDD